MPCLTLRQASQQGRLGYDGPSAGTVPDTDRVVLASAPRAPALTPVSTAAVGIMTGGMRVTVDADANGGDDVIHISLATERPINVPALKDRFGESFSRAAPDAPGPDNPSDNHDADAASSGAVCAAGTGEPIAGTLCQSLEYSHCVLPGPRVPR